MRFGLWGLNRTGAGCPEVTGCQEAGSVQKAPRFLPGELSKRSARRTPPPCALSDTVSHRGRQTVGRNGPLWGPEVLSK